jgi:predicted nucleic acid-binding protein
VIVVDASVLVNALADDADAGDLARESIRGQALIAPHLTDIEFLSVLRRQVARGEVLVRRAEFAVRDLLELRMRRAPHAPFADRIWQLRDNLTPYDAAYVAVAEALQVPLLTADRRLAKAPGIRCEVTLLT